MDKGKNIIICGLGGQGIILLGKILENFYWQLGYHVKVSNVMGLGQRGGNVECHFRYSVDKIYSPLLLANSADYVIALEKNELLRNLHYLKNGGSIIYNNYNLNSPTTNIGLEKDININLEDILNLKTIDVKVIDIHKTGMNISKICKLSNIIALSYYITKRGYDNKIIINLIKNTVKKEYIEDNIRAYNYGKLL